jgi:hypothetical protein
MRVLQTRHELGFCFKAADEIGVIGKSRQDDLYSNVPVHVRLHRTID